MKKFTAGLVAAFVFLWAFYTPALAQNTRVWSSCGSASWSANDLSRQLALLTTGELCVNATVNASISGFHWESSLTPLSVTTTTASSAAFTAGKTVIVDNVGATNDIFCRLGPTATTAAKPIKPGTWMAFTSTSETVVACITSTSTSTANIQVGTGLATGAGGSGGSGGGGAITIASGAVASGAYSSGAFAAGSMVDLLTMRQTVAAGAVASNSLLIGGIYNSTPITVTNGQGAAAQLDANGYLKVNVAAGGGSGGTSSSFAAAFPATGTAVGMTQGGNMVALSGTSGNLNVQCANCSGSGVSTVDAATFTASTSLFAGTGGFFQTTATNNALTNGQQGMWQMTANRAGFVNLRDTSGVAIGTSAAEVFVGGRGTAGSAAGGVLTVQGVASMTPLFMQSATVPVSTMNAANASNLGVANAYVFDDTSPTAITENNFGFARMSANRNVYQTIRDAAGNERGANVDASNRLTTAPSLVSGSVASGALASGSIASGAIASGAVSAGALAAGAGVDGWDLTQGAIADASVTAGATGSVSAKLRRISADIDSIKTAATTPLDNSSAVINVSTATTTQLVAISASTLVRVTAFSIVAGGTGTIKFVYGTGTNCGTGTTDLTGAYDLTAQAGIALGSGLGTLFKGAAGNALCVTTSAAVNMRGHVTYQQF